MKPAIDLVDHVNWGEIMEAPGFRSE